MDDPRRVVATGYDAIAAAYADASVASRTGDSYFRRFLDERLADLAPGSRILDLGCGAGLISAELAERGRVVSLDLSLEQLREARRRAPGATLVLGDMTEIAFRAAAFDAVAAFWSVIHVPRERHAALLERVRSWLRSGGVLFGTFGSGDNPSEHTDDFLGASMYWSHFDGDANRRLLADAGFDIEHADVVADQGEQHLWVVARA